jgi:hypothetical protein
LRDPLSPKNVSFDDCHFGTKCFQQVTKVKSRIVLEILKLGYNVLLSDVDVYWFDNPMPFLYSLGPATFGAQSDEYNETGDDYNFLMFLPVLVLLTMHTYIYHWVKFSCNKS